MVATHRKAETPMNVRKPPTEGKFLSQKVVTNGRAGTSYWKGQKDQNVAAAPVELLM